MKPNARVWKLVLWASLVINVLMAGVCYQVEKRTSFFTRALVYLNLIEADAKSLPDFWAVFSWSNTIEKLRIDFDVAFFGNSITRGSDFQSYFPDKKIINLGYSGDKITGMMRRVRMLKSAHPKKVFIMGGTNDIFRATPDVVIERYRNLLDIVQDSLPNAQIYVESILPMNPDLKENSVSDEVIQAVNEKIRILANERQITFIDLYHEYVEDGKLPASMTKDGLHLIPEAYDKWAEKIRPFIYDDDVTALQ